MSNYALAFNFKIVYQQLISSNNYYQVENDNKFEKRQLLLTTTLHQTTVDIKLVSNKMPLCTTQANIFRPYLNMEGKSSTQRERFFFTFPCQLSGQNPEYSEFETFYQQFIANLQ